jgi:hypothetical protein
VHEARNADGNVALFVLYEGKKKTVSSQKAIDSRYEWSTRGMGRGACVLVCVHWTLRILPGHSAG